MKHSDMEVSCRICFLPKWSPPKGGFATRWYGPGFNTPCGVRKLCWHGVVCLVGLGVLSLLFGSARRFYDTRIYSGIFCQIAPEMAATEKQRGSSVSKISARSTLLTEFVEFLENSMPEIIGGTISLVGILVIIATLNLNVFFACLGILVVMLIVYGLSGKINYRLNANYNTQLEKQVEAIESNKSYIIKSHYRSLMKWNIKLSDLETINYFVIWISVIALFIYTPIVRFTPILVPRLKVEFASKKC